jgi:hypothetical protein
LAENRRWPGLFSTAPTKNVSVVVGFSPPDKSAYVFVTIEKIAPNKTLSQDVNESIATIRKDIPDYKILESEQTTLASLPAYKLVSEETIPMRKIGEKFGVPNEKIQEIESMLKAIGGNPKVKVLTVFAIKDNKEYGVSYGTAPELLAGDQYSVYLPTAQKMIDSFQIMGSSAVTNTSTVKPTINEQNQTCGQFLDPLKTRLVEGNITIQQYGDLRKAIGC